MVGLVWILLACGSEALFGFLQMVSRDFSGFARTVLEHEELYVAGRRGICWGYIEVGGLSWGKWQELLTRL